MNHRRELLAALAGLGLAGCAGPSSSLRRRRTFGEPRDLISPGDRILFQGDSITDAGRSRETADVPNLRSTLGGGYAWLAASSLLVARPGDELSILNRGISGNKVHQLADRWGRDCLELEPDVLSVLIGVNDHWHTLDGGYDGTVEVYERDLDELLDRTVIVLPRVKLVLCEPFVLRCGSVDDSWFPVFDGYREAAARMAEKYDAAWVAFQSAFDEACSYAPPEHWAPDGVHPSASGAALMASCWLRAVGA